MEAFQNITNKTLAALGELEPSPIAVKIEAFITQRLNKILTCSHVFDGKQGDVPKEWLLVCRECLLHIRAEAISYADFNERSQ